MKSVGNSYINRKLYYEMFKKNNLRSLAYFLFLTINHRSRRFKKENSGVKIGTLEKHLAILSKYNLVRYERGLVVLASQSEIDNLYKVVTKTRVLFTKETTLHNIYYFLQSVPGLNRIRVQVAKENRKAYLRNIIHRVNSGFKLTKREYNTYLCLNKKEKNINKATKASGAFLSLSMIMNLNGVSKPTAVKIRNYINNMGFYSCKKNKVVRRNWDLMSFQAMQMFGSIPSHASYSHKHKTVCYNEANTYELVYKV